MEERLFEKDPSCVHCGTKCTSCECCGTSRFCPHCQRHLQIDEM